MFKPKKEERRIDWSDKINPPSPQEFRAVEVLIEQATEHYNAGHKGISKDILIIAKNAIDDIIENKC